MLREKKKPQQSCQGLCQGLITHHLLWFHFSFALGKNESFYPVSVEACGNSMHPDTVETCIDGAFQRSGNSTIKAANKRGCYFRLASVHTGAMVRIWGLVLLE